MTKPSTPQNAAAPGLAPAQRELMANLGQQIGARWVAGAGVLVATAIARGTLGLHLETDPLYAIGLAILAYNVLLYWVYARMRRASPVPETAARRLATVQIAADWVAMTLIIHFSGGVESPAILYFLLHVTLASLLFSPRTAFLYVALATLLVGGMVLLEYAGAIPHVAVVEFLPSSLYRNTTYVAGILFFFVSTMLAVAYLATSITGRVRKSEAEVLALGHSLQHAYGRQETLYQVAQAVNSTLDLQQVLDRLVEDTTRTMEIRGCSIRLLDESGTRLRVAAVYGLSEAYVKKGDLEVARNPLVREVLAGKTIVVGDLTHEPRLQYQAEAIAEGLRSTLTVALPGKDGPLGIIRAYSAEEYHFSPDEVDFLSAIAGQGSIAIENALAYQELGRLSQMKSDFSRAVTHEMRSPVSVVRSLLRTMLAGYAGTMTDLQRDVVERALRRADFLQTLVDDLLDLALGKSPLTSTAERVPVTLGAAVTRVMQRFEIPAQEKRIMLEWRCEDGSAPVTVLADHDDVDCVLNNLMSNAIKYTPSGGRVYVRSYRADLPASGHDEVCLEISDTGIGIPPESMPHLFEEFYRAPNARLQEKEGTGLGLAIAKDMAARYGGRIAVRSDLGAGTTFTVTWPIAVP